MADAQSAKPQPRKKRRWLRRLLYSVLVFLLLVVAFHRPIIHHGGRWLVIWLAKRQHMALDLRIKGSIWSRLEVQNLSLTATNTGRAPIERASVDRFAAEYDFWKIVKGDLSGLRLIDIGKADVVLTPALDVDPEPPQPVAEKIRAFFSRPLPTPVVRVERVDLHIKEETNDAVLRGIRAEIDPGKEGVLAWERIELPGVPVIDAGKARVLLTGDRIEVTDAAIWPEVRVVSVRGQRPQGDARAEVAVEVEIPEGQLTAVVNPVLNSNAFEARVKLETRGIPELAPRFGLTMPLVVESLSLDVQWKGVPEAAGSSSGSVTFSASGRKDIVYPGFVISGNAALTEGTLTISNTEARIAETVITASGTFDATRTLSYQGSGKAPLPVGSLDFRVNAPDLQKVAAEFGEQARGRLEFAGTATTVPDALSIGGKVTAAELGHKDLSLGVLNATFSAYLPRSDDPPLAVLDAKINAIAEGLKSGTIEIDRVQAGATLQALEATVSELVVTRGNNQLKASVRARLRSDGKLAESPSANFSLDAPALSEFGIKIDNEPLSGAARGTGTVSVQNGKLNGNAQITATDLAMGPTTAGDVTITTTAVNGVTTTKAVVKRGRNELQANARAVLTETLKLAEPPKVDFTIDAAALGEFGVKLKGAPVAGTVKGTGALTLAEGKPEGTVQLTASDLTIGDAKAGNVVADIAAADGAIVARSLRAQFNANDYLEASGRMDLNAPRAYQGSVALRVRDLGAYEPILDALGEKRQLAGNVQLDWTGKGDAKTHEGDGKLHLRGFRMDKTEITEARLTATYNPERADVPEFLVVADQLRATGKLDWINKRLNLRGLEVLLAGKTVVTGDASVPLDPFGKSVLPGSEPINASIAARNLDLARVFRELKLPPKVEGTLTATLTGSGSLDAPVVKLDAAGKGMRLPPPPDLTDEQRSLYATARGDLELDAGFENDRLSVSGVFRHADIRPLTVKVDAPLELKPILEGRIPDVKSIPFTASVEMPASSLAILPKLNPQIARADGTMAISMQASGSIQQPKLTGQVTANARSIRLANSSIPPIANLAIRIGLAGTTVTVQQFQGETGGGRFSLGGTVVATNLLEPVVDLRVRTDKVLAMRNDSVLVRVDADIQLRGPFNAGTATGRVVLAQSRFNKEIQILPILMPGRPKPVPREVSQPVVISFPNPPLRDWKFDIAIVTINEDPFLVRGNLAKGQVTVDLRLQGTGLEPYLVGSATLDQFSAQLPVSRLTTRRGVVNFTQENPFEPRLEIESETVIRGYTIIARLEGPASAPRLDLTSEPPLPQQDIMTLLTTGGLSGELGENNTALATRAGLMVLRDLYKKVFKRDLPVPTDQGGDNFFGRFNVDLGAVDSRTGRQEITAQFRITDRVVIVGDVEMGGGISGRIQYQFRFR